MPTMPSAAALSGIPPGSARLRRTPLHRAAELLGLTALGLTVLGLSGCGAESESVGDPAQPESTQGEDTGLLIIASIDVYSDLAETVVGDTAEVEPVVDNPAMDPHSYEATPQDRLRVENADIMIANGGGYDPFLTRLAASAGKEDEVFQLIDGANEHVGGDDGAYENEHIWYDLGAMSDFVGDFADHMGEVAPENAELYQQNADELSDEIESLDERNRAIAADGLTYLATEPVSQFLLLDAGFEDLTEESFLAAVEHGDDVSPRLYQDALDTVTGGDITVLAYNEQTETNQSQQIRSAAEDAGVPVLEFSETFPDDIEDFLDWMEYNIEQVEDVVGDERG